MDNFNFILERLKITIVINSPENNSKLLLKIS